MSEPSNQGGGSFGVFGKIADRLAGHKDHLVTIGFMAGGTAGTLAAGAGNPEALFGVGMLLVGFIAFLHHERAKAGAALSAAREENNQALKRLRNERRKPRQSTTPLLPLNLPVIAPKSSANSSAEPSRADGTPGASDVS